MGAIPGYKANIYVSGGASTPLSPIAMTDSGDHMTFTVTNSAHKYLDPGVPVTVQTSPDGVTWTSVTTGFNLRYCGGVIQFTNPVSGATPSVQLLNGAYFAVSLAGQAKTVEIQTPVDVLDVSAFESNGWKSKLVLLSDATWKLSRWWLDNFYFLLLRQLVVLVAYSGANSNQRYESYALLKGDDIKIDVKSAVEESLDFESTGGIFFTLS